MLEHKLRASSFSLWLWMSHIDSPDQTRQRNSCDLWEPSSSLLNRASISLHLTTKGYNIWTWSAMMTYASAPIKFRSLMLCAEESFKNVLDFTDYSNPFWTLKNKIFGLWNSKLYKFHHKRVFHHILQPGMAIVTSA